MYQKGFSYKLGTVKVYQGKAVWEVILTANDKKRELENITPYVTKNTYEPVYIQLQQRGQRTHSEITVTTYQTGLDHTNHVFAPDRKAYSIAEVIDLR